MPRYAPELECSVEDKASLVALAKSRTAEAHAVERARIILACLEGKEIQQVARELGVSVATVSKMAPALLPVGAERTTRPAAARKAGQI